MTNGSVSTCAGAFLDSGGQGASGYSDNEDLTYTICPDVAGDAISLDFITFNLSLAGIGPVDVLSIHDGNSIAAPLLGLWTGNALQGTIVSASPTNTSGCLTVVFNSNEAGTGVFAASITCFQPCERPTAIATHGVQGPLRICPGESVTFNSSGSFAAAGFSIASRRWEFGDGSVQNNAPVNAAHTYNTPGAYIAQLYVTDNNGCVSANRVDLVIMVGTEPTFTGTTGDQIGCVGEELCLQGVVNPTTWIESPDAGLGGGVFLPDQVGQCFTSELTFNQFPPGQTINSVNDLQSICVDMEHSFIGDLVISIISPTGQTVILHQQGGGDTFLGIPVDDDFQPNAQGTCWNYCWSPASNNGTWVANAGGTLPSGTYESENSLIGLVGSQLNGTWTIEVCDLWASDNGFICNWELQFDPSLYDDLLIFTPTIGAECDSSFWDGPGDLQLSPDCNEVCITPSAPGNFTYTYAVTDNHGCTYDTTLTVTVVTPTNAGDDGTLVRCTTSAPTSLFTALNGTPQGGGTWSGPNGPTNASFNPATEPSGIYTYTLTGAQACQTSSAQVEVIVVEPPDAGIDTTLTLCTSGNNVNLFNRLGGDPQPGGTWTGPNGASVGPAFDPGVSPPGTYTYLLNNALPCPADVATVVVTVNEEADPGIGDTLLLCSVGAPIDLYDALGGTPDQGGTWNGPDPVINDLYDPTTMSPGNYRYRVQGTAPCPDRQSIIRVELQQPPDPGTNGLVELCASAAPISLFAALGGDPQSGGAWSGPSPVTNALFDPPAMLPGTYTYTVSGEVVCPDRSANVLVSEVAPPDAGTDGALLLCPEAAPVELFNLLGGSPQLNGQWTAPDGDLHGTLFEAGTDAPGPYVYTVVGSSLCPISTATVILALHTVVPPDAGPNALSCTLSDTVTATGSWSSGVWTAPPLVSIAQADAPVTNLTSTIPGDYTLRWSVLDGNGCAAFDTVTVTLNVPLEVTTIAVPPICTGDCSGSAVLTPEGGSAADGYSIVWSNGVNEGTFTPTDLCAGTFGFTITDDNACSLTGEFMLTDPPPIAIDKVIAQDERCPGSCDGVIAVLDADGAAYSVDGGVTLMTTPLFSGLCPGVYPVLMQDTNGCIALGEATIGTPPPVVAGLLADRDTVTLADPTVNFTNTSSGTATSFIWDFGNGSRSTEVSPTHRFEDALGDVYEVCLTALDVNACADTACLEIVVLDLLAVHVPNAFSPNGDGINDGFGPVFNAPWVKEYSLLIFDRWGEEVFTSTRPEERWNGGYGSAPPKPDLYVWKLRCVDALSGEPIERMGHVTVLQ
jgi:gliding motility-associated-like protein